MPHYLGIDIGTSGTKALLMDARGRVSATATAAHPIYAPQPAWSEQRPAEWWRSTVEAVRAVMRKSKVAAGQVAGIGLSGQMHGLVITDEAGKSLRPAIIWNDQRSAREAQEIEAKVGREELIGLVGNVAVTSFTLTKLLWVRRYEPRVYAKIRHLLLPKDYIRLRLTGEYMGDVSDMSGTLMLDQRKRDWSPEMLSRFDVDRAMLPPVVESQEIAGRLTQEAAGELGLKAGIAVAAGGGDQPVGAVGNGVVADGLTSATLGTSGVVYTHSRQYRTDPQGRIQTFCSCVKGQWCMFGCILAAGGSLQWFRNTLGAEEVSRAKRLGVDPYELIVKEAAAAAPGCEGVYWLPYLTGERTPHNDPHARACWVGITARTGRRELARAVMEGATFAMNDAVSLLRAGGLRIRQVRLSGGGARSEFWRQLQADIYGATCVTIQAQEGPAYGAAILAAVGAGEYRSVPEACSAMVKVTRTIRPSGQRKVYGQYYREFARLYPALREEFGRMDTWIEPPQRRKGKS